MITFFWYHPCLGDGSIWPIFFNLVVPLAMLCIADFKILQVKLSLSLRINIPKSVPAGSKLCQCTKEITSVCIFAVYIAPYRAMPCDAIPYILMCSCRCFHVCLVIVYVPIYICAYVCMHVSLIHLCLEVWYHVYVYIYIYVYHSSCVDFNLDLNVYACKYIIHT